MRRILKNGTVINYATNTNDKLDILIEDGKIKTICSNLELDVDEVIDCTGLYIMPGMVDIHCHLREPGFEYKETIESGCKSAVKGGFTTICAMPNTKPVPDNADVLKWIIEEGKRVNLCNVFSYSTVSKGELGRELVDFEEQVKTGAIAFSDDGVPLKNSKLMRDAIIKTTKLGKFVASHCEDEYFIGGGINAGPVAEKLGVEGVCRESEEIMAAREIAIASINNARVHLCHISTEGTVALVKDAKTRGVGVTTETCPHYFMLTDEEALISGSNAKINPPLRTKKDIEAIIKGLQDGTIDAIVTDHAPHSKEEKSRGLAVAPWGVIAFETALAVTITALVDKGYISYLDMVKLMSYNPAKLINIDKGTIEEEKDADFTIFNPNIEYTYTEDMIVSKSKNSPFIGKKLKGKVVYTIVGGNIVYKDNTII